MVKERTVVLSPGDTLKSPGGALKTMDAWAPLPEESGLIGLGVAWALAF